MRISNGFVTAMSVACLMATVCSCSRTDSTGPRESKSDSTPQEQNVGDAAPSVNVAVDTASTSPKVTWFRSGDPAAMREIDDTLSTFRMKEDEAFQVAIKLRDSDRSAGLPTKTLGVRPIALVGRTYVFGEFFAAMPTLEGYYVDGDTGKGQWQLNPEDIMLYRLKDPDIGPRLTNRIASFHVNLEQAYQIALDEEKRREAKGLPIVMLGGRPPLALVGRNYLFGRMVKFATVTDGYLVNGDSGEVSWRDKRPKR